MIRSLAARSADPMMVLLGVTALSLPAVGGSNTRSEASDPRPIPSVSLATSSDVDSTRDPGDWYVVNVPEAMMHARPHAAEGSYPVAAVPLGTPVLVVGFDNGSAMVPATSGTTRALLELDAATDSRDDRVRILEPTRLLAPDLRNPLDDGRPDPSESRHPMLELVGGEDLRVLDRYETAGGSWALVEPPSTATLFLRGGEIRPARRDEIPTTRPSAAAPAVDATVLFEDGVRGTWRVVRARGQSIRTGPNANDNYSIDEVDKGDVLAVVATDVNGWCSVRLVGPHLEDVRALLKAVPGAIDESNGLATVRRGRHELRAVNRTLDRSGPPSPKNAYLRFRHAAPDETFTVTARIEDEEGDVWLEVIPPLDAVGWIHQAYLVPASRGEMPVEQGRDRGDRPRYADSSSPAGLVPVAVESAPEAANAAVVPETPPTVAAAGASEPAGPEVSPVDAEPTPTTPEPAIPVDPETPKVDLTDAGDLEAPAEIVLVVEEDEASTSTEDDVARETVQVTDTLAGVTFEAAEETYREIRDSARNDSELEAIEIVFLAISTREGGTDAERTRARTRVEQIGIQRQLQQRIDRLRRLEERTRVDRDRIEAIRQALLDRADYTAIGRLSLSRVYDGRRLPRLYRLEEPGSGRTLAYVRPDEDLRIEAGLGRIVGIVGVEREDPGRRIRIITPERFEIDMTEIVTED